ncbi:MarR family winged helix-turn-helix transcriptional regulator [Rothia uropygialis]|uniref:MarR family winged helix-turn-helix transcriptional regulator n=1 Tax=Kocuria sp. 36 TaxID=1415402 RepID=UPI00101C3F6D|nr:MarR family transcriptional regulator [Kocuria sp. 36]
MNKRRDVQRTDGEPRHGGQTPLESTEIAGDAVFLLEKLGAIGTLDANRELKDFGLNARSFSVLSLAGENEAPTQKALAEMLTLDPSQIVALVDRLESEGLVERVPDARDRRIRRIRATAQGDAVRKGARAQVLRAQERTLGQLDAKEVQQLVGLLGKALFGRDQGIRMSVVDSA